jgi:D-serine deaminase-like pyridoxal phosphate-dependent protein
MPDQSGGLRLDDIRARPIDWQYKAFPVTGDPVSIGDAGKQGWNALQPPFSTPVMVLKDRALQHNIDVMADYCSGLGVSLAPHTKTPVAPQIADRQLAAGAWALTVADVHQARVLRETGARRLLMANEVADAAAASWIAREVSRDPDLELFCLVDSERGARILDQQLANEGFRGRLPVLIELGIPGARCGCRTVADGVTLARQVARLDRLGIAGVEGYENLFPAGTADETIPRVDGFLGEVRALAVALDAEGHFAGVDEILVSAGGSMWFDRAAAVLTGHWELSRPVRTVVRAGAYVAHDAAFYQEFSPLGERAIGPQTLGQAIELWAAVLSRPESDLAILNFGKRDAAHDRGLPIPFATRTEHGFRGVLPGEYEVVALSDQHARLRLPANAELAVGDLVGSHISHPCTSFGNWRLVPLVSDDYDVIGTVRSYL